MPKADAVAQSSDWNVTLAKVADLVPYIRNTRTHSDEQVSAIMGSMIEFGFTKPVLIDKDGIIAGHGAAMAAGRLYELDKTIKTPSGRVLPDGCIPVIDCTGWSQAQRKAYIIADNALSDRGGWDREKLLLEVGDLESMGFNMDKIGWDTDELSKLLYPDHGENEEPGDGGTPDEPGAGNHAVVVACRDPEHQQEVFEALQAEGYEVTVLSN